MVIFFGPSVFIYLVVRFRSNDPVSLFSATQIKKFWRMFSLRPGLFFCRHAFTSTWLSVSAKGIDIREFLGDYLDPLPGSLRLKPVCEPEVPNSLLTFDHLTGVKMRDRLHLASEAGNYCLFHNIFCLCFYFYRNFVFHSISLSLSLWFTLPGQSSIF